MSELALTPADFQPIKRGEEGQAIARPSLSYWQDAWIRLKSNRRALISLWIVIALIGFTLVGPFLWPVDSSLQDVDQVSQAPGADRSVTVVASFTPWDGDAILASDTKLMLVDVPNTQSVRLKWQVQEDVSGYKVYRNIYATTKPGDGLGLPLATIYNNKRSYFEDRLNLRPETLYYTVVGTNELGELTGFKETVRADIIRTITPFEAERRGLVEDANTLAVGDSLTLALHPFGTDYLGRDLLARLMEGARVSLFIGIFAPLFFVLFGVLYGSIAGFVGGKVDQLLMRFADFVVALPFLLFMILFKIAFGIGPGESGILPMLVALVLLSWPSTARLVRGQILQIREEGYISASKLLGAKTNYLVMRHMIPNTMGVILVTLTFAVPSAIFTEAFLSFIGMGVAPPTPSWGSMCNEGIKTMLTHPHELFFPALFISVTVLAFNLLGDGLRDALDARMRSRE